MTKIIIKLNDTLSTRAEVIKECLANITSDIKSMDFHGRDYRYEVIESYFSDKRALGVYSIEISDYTNHDERLYLMSRISNLLTGMNILIRTKGGVKL